MDGPPDAQLLAEGRLNSFVPRMIGQKSVKAVHRNQKQFMHGTVIQPCHRTTNKVSAALKDALRRNGQAS